MTGTPVSASKTATTVKDGETISPWHDALDDEVTLGDFAERYEWVSPLYEDDGAFEDMMRAAWGLK